MTFVRRERVRLRDCDAMGHVNNAVYSTFLEEARLEALGGLAESSSPASRSTSARSFALGEEIEVRTRAARGSGRRASTSSTRSARTGALAAEAKSVLVGYDYELRRERRRCPTELKERLSGDSSIGLTSVASRSSVSWSNGAGQST